MDPTSESRLALVHPKLAGLIRQLADQLAQQSPPITIRVTQGFRSWAEQQALWQKGRDEDGLVIGETVTDALPGYSWHNLALAVDVAPFVDGVPDWNPDHADWQTMLAVGKALGLVEGACWHKPDDPHLQLADYPVTPTDEDRQLFVDGGQQAVWEHYNL